MRDFETKINNTAPAPTGRLDAGQFNILADEIKGIVPRAGITLDPPTGPDTSRVMLADAIARISSAAHFGVDNGAVNTHVVVSPYGPAGFTMPGALFRGMAVLFRAIATNTGATTLNAFGLGAKPVVDHNADQLVGGEIVIRRPLVLHYEPSIGSAGAWMLEPWSNALVVAGAAGGGSIITGGPGGTGLTMRLAFRYIGADQQFIVPAGITSIKAKLWGAGGGGHNNAAGGPGGYTEGVIAVTPGTTLKIVVGQSGPGFSSVSGAGYSAAAYGFGGRGYCFGATNDNDQAWSGGGLSGIFTTSVSKANALFIAGGGGGASFGATLAAIAHGGAGNDAVHAGGVPGSGMTGEDAPTNTASYGGGGGGYIGGGAGAARGQYRSGGNPYAGEGGTGFAHGSATSVSIQYTSDITSNLPPNRSDVDYEGKVGVGAGGDPAQTDSGLVVIYY